MTLNNIFFLNRGNNMSDLVSKHDFLYYELKEMRQSLDFWENEASHNTRGAKVRAKNLKSKISEMTEHFYELGHKLGYAV